MPCAYSESFVRGGTNLITFFFSLVDGCIEDPNTAINGPHSARHLNGVSLAGRCWPNIECWLRGSGPVLERNPIFL